jgi:hypothetical protein
MTTPELILLLAVVTWLLTWSVLAIAWAAADRF